MGLVVFVDQALKLSGVVAGGLLLAVVSWLALLTIFACRNIRLVSMMNSSQKTSFLIATMIER